jgi:DNA-binding winged helix-turn-helix (wHTH) protein
MTDISYHFGRCELRLGTRELLVDGKAQAIEPLAFDLLAYLLRYRDRDVSKDELLDEVWLGRIVSVGAVARAAMTVRNAIGRRNRPLITGAGSVTDSSERSVRPRSPRRTRRPKPAL